MKKNKIQMNDQELSLEPAKLGRKYRFPFDKLEVGYSFTIIGMSRNNLGPYKRYAEQALNRKFTTLKVGSGVIVKRIA